MGENRRVRVIQRLLGRKEWKFFAALPKADGRLAFTWWAVVLLHGLLPALFAIAMGVLVDAVQRGDSLTVPLGVIGVIFVLLQVLTPIQTGRQPQPRRPDGGVALRPPDRGLRAAPRDGAPGGSEARPPTSRSRATSTSA